MIVGLMGVFVAPLVRFTIREPERGSLDYPQASDSFTSSDQRREYASDILGVLKFLLGKPSFWLLSFGAASASVCGYGLAAWLPSFFVRSFGLSLSETAGYYAGITFLGGVVGIWCGGQIADKLGLLARSAYPLVPAVAFVISVPCFILAMNIQGILYSLFANLEHADWGGLSVAFIVFLVPTALSVVWLGPVSASIQHLVPVSMRATASALMLLINNLFGIAGGVFYFGWMSDALRPMFGEESLRWSIYSGLVFYFISAALFFVASRTLKRDWVD